MENNSIDKIYKWGVRFFIIVFSFFILYLNLLYPYYSGDDMIFQLKIPDDGIIGSERITSISDLIESQVNFYLNYHYRVINHTVLQALLAFPPIVFDVLNVFVFLLLPWTVLKISGGTQQKHYLEKYTIALCAVWILHLNLGWCYWPTTGALNYTWMLIPQIWHLCLLLEYLDGKLEKTYPLTILAVINSMANENVCLSLLAVTLYVAWQTRHRKDKTLWLCIAISILGGMFMLASPSIGKRLATQGFREAGIVSHVLEYLRRTIYFLIRYSPLLLILFATKNRGFNLRRREYLIILAFVVGTGSMVLPPLFEPRSAIYGFFLVMLGVFSLVGHREIKRPFVLLFISASVLLCLMRYPAFKEHYARHQINENILTAHQGKTEAYLNRYCDDTFRDFILCHEISENAVYMDNETLAAVYQIGEVKLDPKYVATARAQEAFRRIESSTDYLMAYESQQVSENWTLFHKTSKEGTEIVSRQKGEQEPYYIIRGKLKGLDLDMLASWLPDAIQIYFLDYLEYITERSQPSIKKDGYTYSYNFVPYSERYDYFLISEYSFDDHAPFGPITKLDH